MAMLTRFWSTSSAPENIQTTKMDPNVAGAPGQAAAHQAEAVQEGLVQSTAAYKTGAAQGFVDAMQKRDQLLYEQGRMQLTLDAHNLMNQYQQDPRPGSVKLPEMNDKYNQMIQDTNSQFSSPGYAGLLAAHSGILMSRMTGHLEAQDMHQQQQLFEQNLGKFSNEYASMLYRQPDALPQIQQQFGQYAQQMQNYGFNPAQVGSLLDKAQGKLAQASYQGLAAQQPETMLNMINSGALKDKPLSTQLSLQNQAQATITGRQNAVNGDLKNLEGMMVQGQSLPDSAEQVLSNAQALGLDGGVKRILQADQLRDSISSFPVAEQQSRLDNFLATQQANPTMLPQDLQLAKKTMEGQIKLATKDPLNYAVSQGIIPSIQPLVTDPTDPNFAASMENRRQQVAKASAFTGQPVSPLTQAEAAQTNSSFGAMPVDKQQALLGHLSTFGPDSAALASAQLGKHNATFGAASSLMTDYPEMATSILNGQKMIESGAAIQPKLLDKQQAVTSVLGGLMDHDPEQLQQIVSAASARFVDKNRLGDTQDFAQSIKDVTGAVKLNSGLSNLFSGPAYNTMVPITGMTQGQMEDTISGLDANKLATYGNGAPRFADGTIATPDQAKKFQFFPTGYGQYVLKQGNNTLVTDDLKTPYTLDMRKMIQNPALGATPLPPPTPEEPTNPNMTPPDGPVTPVPTTAPSNAIAAGPETQQVDQNG